MSKNLYFKMLARKTLPHTHVIQRNSLSMDDYIYIYIYIKLATLVEGDPKASFSIAITPRCREGCYSFPWIAPLYFDPHLIMLSVKQGGIKYHSLSLWYDSTWDWTPVSWTIGEQCTHSANGPVMYERESLWSYKICVLKILIFEHRYYAC